MLKGKSFLNYVNLFSPNDYEKNDKLIVKYFQQLKRWTNYIALFVVSIENLKNLNNILVRKKQFFVLFAVSGRMKMNKYLKKKNQLK